MLTFEQAYEFTKTIGSHTSFEEEECRAYFDILMRTPKHSLIVEVGLEYGRSSSIALQVARVNDLDYVGIDPFPDVKVWESWIENFAGLSPLVYKHKSCDVDGIGTISAILIDGDHSYEGVKADCEHFLPHVRMGGFAMFHDFDRESLPEVAAAARDYLDQHPSWELLKVVGTLAIWRKR
jgi:cephalosporin hydroxylase